MADTPSATPGPDSDRSQLARRVRQTSRENASIDAATSLASRLLSPWGPKGKSLTGDVDPPPFFIVGSGRSGNTLLRRMLIQSPQVHIPPETYVLGRVIKVYEKNAHLEWPLLVQLVLSTFEYRDGFEAFGVSLRPLYQQLKDVDRSKRNLASIIDSIYRFHGEETGRTFDVWGDKTPLNAFSMFRIHRVFPASKFVHVLRDGVDVVHSYVDRGLFDDAYEASTRWVGAVDAINRFGDAHPQLVEVVRYEDLVSDPGSVLSQVCEFLGIDFTEDMVASNDLEMGDTALHEHHERAHSEVTTTRIGSGRDWLNADTPRFSPGFSELLVAMGYQPVPG